MRLRALLWIGFGGLLALLTFIGVSALSVIGSVQMRNDQIRSDYLRRASLLDDLSSETYLSGTYVRDFLLEPDDRKAAAYRDEFFHARLRIENAMAAYRKLVRPEETAAFNSLTSGLREYFDALQPALHWSSGERERFGRAFMQDEVQRRRMSMLDLANKAREVNRAQLEAGNAEIRHLFTQFRRTLVVVLGLTLMVGVALAAVSMSRIFRLQKETAERYRESEELSAKLVDAQEQERRAIARELHDEIGQSLSALLLGIGNLGKSHPEAAEDVAAIRTQTEKLVGTVRNMSLLLRPSMLDDLGLVPALQWQARETSRATGMRVSVVAENTPEDLPDEFKTAIYRIVQEALHNCQKHSKANVVRVQLETAGRWLHLSVQDDGQGFRPDNRGFGLLGMEERVKRFGGKLKITSQEGTGTLLDVSLPRG